MNEVGVDPGKLIPVLHYDGAPITARFIAGAIARHLGVSAPANAPYVEAAE